VADDPRQPGDERGGIGDRRYLIFAA